MIIIIITKELIVKDNRSNRYYYKDAIINELDNKLILDISKMPRKSNKKIEVKCDYCGDIIQVSIDDYTRIMDRNHNDKYACKKCRKYKTKETMIEKYGVENCSQLEDVKNKKKETVFKNYGCEYPMQSELVRQKSKKSMIEKYGVEHNFYRKDILDKVSLANSHQKFQNGTAPCSKAQKHIAELCNGILNYPVDRFNLDILIEGNIYIEYNGSGHDLNVRMGQITKSEFNRKEVARYRLLKNIGYKEIIIDNYSDKLPRDDVIIDLINGLSKFLKYSDNNWIRINFDNMKITTKHCEIFYMIN